MRTIHVGLTLIVFHWGVLLEIQGTIFTSDKSVITTENAEKNYKILLVTVKNLICFALVVQFHSETASVQIK